MMLTVLPQFLVGLLQPQAGQSRFADDLGETDQKVHHRPHPLLGEDGGFSKGRQVGPLVETEFLGLAAEVGEIRWFEEELPGEEICDVFTADIDRDRDVDQTIPAAIDVVGLPTAQASGEDGIALVAT